MPISLSGSKKDDLRHLFTQTGSIRAVAKASGLSRNTVRKTLRREGLSTSMPPRLHSAPVANLSVSGASAQIESLDLMLLDKLFALVGEPEGAKDFTKQIRSLALEIGEQFGVRGRADTLRLEGAVVNYITWRRFLFRSLEASDKQYCGPLMKQHEKLAMAVDRWTSASNKAFDQMNRILREFEIKSGQRAPDLGRNNVFVANQQVNLHGQGGPTSSSSESSGPPLPLQPRADFCEPIRSR